MKTNKRCVTYLKMHYKILFRYKNLKENKPKTNYMLLLKKMIMIPQQTYHKQKTDGHKIVQLFLITPAKNNL